MSPHPARYLGQPPHGATLPLPVTGPVTGGIPPIRIPADIDRDIRGGEAPATEAIARRIGLPDDPATLARLTAYLRGAGYLGIEITIGKPARTQLLWVPRAWLREDAA